MLTRKVFTQDIINIILILLNTSTHITHPAYRNDHHGHIPIYKYSNINQGLSSSSKNIYYYNLPDKLDSTVFFFIFRSGLLLGSFDTTKEIE